MIDTVRIFKEGVWYTFNRELVAYVTEVNQCLFVKLAGVDDTFNFYGISAKDFFLATDSLRAAPVEDPMPAHQAT